ncbi:hypothetical protein SESBI_19412 [Sesbania bispinosa]|nr:hypothetical protein SESBI_19412 [Sesbania bispinosa]
MARRRVMKLAYISNDSKRKATYRKRKKGIIKKAWPNREGVERVIERYENTFVIDQSKNVNQELPQGEDFQSEDQLKKLRRDNHEKELTMAMFQHMQDGNLQNMSFEDAIDLNKLIEKNLNDIEIKMTKLSV